MKVVPNFAVVEENQMAVFDCYYSCDVMKIHSHNVYWHVGDVQEFRGFTYRTAFLFTRKTGLQVETEDLTTCDENLNSGTIRHQLRINASSSARWNATAVQCVAVRSNVKQVDFYSPFSLMIVKPKEAATEAPTVTTERLVTTEQSEAAEEATEEATETKGEDRQNSKFIELKCAASSWKSIKYTNILSTSIKSTIFFLPDDEVDTQSLSESNAQAR